MNPSLGARRRVHPSPATPFLRLLAGLLAVLTIAPLPATEPAEAVVEPAALTEQPVATMQVPPDYPFVLRRAGTTGSALVEFVVTKSGEVSDAWIVRATQPEFGTAALRAIKRWKYTPGKINGRPVNTRLRQPLSFSLGEDETAPAPARPLLDRGTFVSMLPAKLYLDGGLSNPPGDLSRCIKALEMLGPTKTSFVKLPKSAKGLHPQSRVPPVYPPELRENNIQGAASFLVCVDEQGDVKAVYNLAATDPGFAHSGAAALAQWKFNPATIGGTAVPVIFERLLTFEVR